MWRSLEKDPKEIRAAAVDAQRISDWLLTRERERTLAHEQTGRPLDGESREHPGPHPPRTGPDAQDSAYAQRVSAS